MPKLSLFVALDLKNQLEMIKKENIALKMKLAQRDQVEDENLMIQPEEKDGTKIQKINLCEKCCLNFPSKDKLKKHKSEMHKVILTF